MQSFVKQHEWVDQGLGHLTSSRMGLHSLSFFCFCAIRWACQRTWGTQLRSQLKGLCFEMCILALLCTSLIIFVLFLSFLCISRLSQSLLVKTVKCQRSFAETFTFSDCCKHSWTRWTSGLEDECNSCEQTTGRAFCDGKALFLQWNGITRDNLMHGTTVWPPKTKELLPAKCKDETIHSGLLKPFQNCSLWEFFGSTAKQSSRNLLLHAVTCCYADRSMIEEISRPAEAKQSGTWHPSGLWQLEDISTGRVQNFSIIQVSSG